MPEQVAQPEYATVVGLVMYGAKARRASPQRAGKFGIKIKVHVRGRFVNRPVGAETRREAMLPANWGS